MKAPEDVLKKLRCSRQLTQHACVVLGVAKKSVGEVDGLLVREARKSQIEFSRVCVITDHPEGGARPHVFGWESEMGGENGKIEVVPYSFHS